MKEIIVSPYDKQWISLFAEESNELRDILGEQVVSVSIVERNSHLCRILSHNSP